MLGRTPVAMTVNDAAILNSTRQQVEPPLWGTVHVLEFFGRAN